MFTNRGVANGEELSGQESGEVDFRKGNGGERDEVADISLMEIYKNAENILDIYQLDKLLGYEGHLRDITF